MLCRLLLQMLYGPETAYDSARSYYDRTTSYR